MMIVRNCDVFLEPEARDHLFAQPLGVFLGAYDDPAGFQPARIRVGRENFKYFFSTDAGQD